MKLTECQKLAIMLVFAALIVLTSLVDINSWISMIIWMILGIVLSQILDKVEVKDRKK